MMRAAPGRPVTKNRRRTPRTAMMEKIRNAMKSGLALIVVGLLIVSFAIWGVQDVFTPSPNDPVAVVGDLEIGQQEFALQYDRVFRSAQAQSGGILTQAEALSDGLHRDVLEGMMQELVVSAAAQELGIRTSDAILQQRITTDPSFAGPTGDFEPQSYAELLRANGFTPQMFETVMRSDLNRNQLIGSIISGYYMLPGLASAHYEYAYERRAIEYFLLPPASAGDIPDPGDEVLTVYYDQAAGNYRAPEYRTVTLLKLGESDITDRIEVPEEDVVRLFEIRESRLQVPERRQIEQLTFQDLASAETALALIEAEIAFEAAGGIFLDLGLLAQDEGIDQAVTDAAFATDEPGVVGIVEGDLSTSIVRVVSITPGSVVLFEDVRDELRRELAEQNAGEEIFAISENAQDMYAGGAPLDEIGGQLNIPVTTATVDSSGLMADGSIATELVLTQGVMEFAFDLVEGEDSGFRDTPDGDFFVLRVQSITPSRQRAFEDVREQVLDEWRDAETAGVLAGMGDEAVARINGGEDFAAVAQSLGREVRETPREIRRTESSEIFSRSVLNTLFTDAVGTVTSGPVLLGGSYVIARATSVTPADTVAGAEQLANLRVALENEVVAEIIEAYITQTETKIDKQINERILTELVSGFN